MSNRMDFKEEDDEVELCPACLGLLHDGRGIHTMRRVHWDCLPEEVKNPTPLKTMLESCDEAIRKLDKLQKDIMLAPPGVRRELARALNDENSELGQLRKAVKKPL